MVFVALNGALTVAQGSGWYCGKKLIVSLFVSGIHLCLADGLLYWLRAF
jgi:hypothetical protein